MPPNPCNATKARAFAGRYLSTIEDSKQMGLNYAFLGKTSKAEAVYVVVYPQEQRLEVQVCQDAQVLFKKLHIRARCPCQETAIPIDPNQLHFDVI